MTPSSYHWLFAEAAAWPIASESGFRCGATQLERQRPGVFKGGTDVLASTLEEHLRPMARGLSLEAVRKLRDYAWFEDDQGDDAARPRALGAYLARIAREHLEYRGCAIGIRADGQMSEVAGRWRWLSFALPADTLVAALAAFEGRPPVDAVDLAPVVLTSHLEERPAAETHLHVGAASSFSMLWSALASSVGSPTFRGDKLLRDKAAPFGSGREFAKRLVEAFIARLLLAGFLRYRRLGTAVSFERWAGATFGSIGEALDSGGGALAAAALRDVCQSLMAAGASHTWPELRLLYRRLGGLGVGRSQLPGSIYARDPLLAVFSGTAVAPETMFQCEALMYAGCSKRTAPGQTDQAFQRLFWQYVRVRTLAFRHLVEQPGTAGLDWFGRHYSRISPLRAGLESTMYRRALEVQSRGISLGALEMRTSPEEQWSAQLRTLKGIAKQAAEFSRQGERVGARGPEVGLVLHLIKEWSRGKKRKALHSDPDSHLYGCRYGVWYHSKLRQIQAIGRVLRYRPEMLILFRGIDAANAELAVPNWVLLPLLEQVRISSHDAAARLHAANPQLQIRPIRTTIHAGEEYRTPLEGLRRMHELVQYGAIASGDRIGHGVALGDDPLEWRRRMGGVFTQPREERLDDLLWILARIAARDISAKANGESVMREEASKLATAMYGRRVQVEWLIEAREKRHAPEILRELGYPFLSGRRMATGPFSHRLLVRYLTDSGVFARGQHAVRMEIHEDELKLICELQQWLRATIGKMDVTVESNPSSNLLIADMVDLQAHPAFRLQPVERASGDARVLLSVNTDNPLTFASCLADEFAYIYHALMRNPAVTADEALAWVVARRDDGWRSRFTLPLSADPLILDHLAKTR